MAGGNPQYIQDTLESGVKSTEIKDYFNDGRGYILKRGDRASRYEKVARVNRE